MTTIPFIPESAPFSPEQRAWLNGFFAGLGARAAQAAAPVAPVAPQATLLFASQTGNAESAARRLALKLKAAGWAPKLQDISEYSMERLASESVLLIAASTYGDGDPPDGARGFWELLASGAAPKISNTRFSVFALGDSNYAKFCSFGRAIDQRLEELGARRIAPRVEADGDFEPPCAKWIDALMPALESEKAAVSAASANGNVVRHEEANDADSNGHAESAHAYTRKNPFAARLIENRKLSGEGSAKDTRHFAISLLDSGIEYNPGDALGVQPRNAPGDAYALLQAQGWSGDELVPAAEGGEKPLREALIADYELAKIARPFLEALAERHGRDDLKPLLEPDAAERLQAYLRGLDVLDLLGDTPGAKFAPAEFLGLLKKMAPRLYSISSSPKAHPGEVHLTVAVVRYESRGRMRRGVASTFLAERVSPDDALPIHIHPSKTFRPPADGATPIIMVGPGTGIAPFRAFLEERRATGASGKNWLFFGDQRESSDFLYREEMLAMRDSGLLTRLDLAFSRDQAQKVYVQHWMAERAPELFAWLESGAHFYVCGDATRMAKDVDAALRESIRVGGGLNESQADDYVKALERSKRYQRDVY